MRTEIIKPGQSAKDLALQHYGSAEGLFLLLRDNALDFDRPAPGTEILIREANELQDRSASNQPIKNTLTARGITVKSNALTAEEMDSDLLRLLDGELLLNDGNKFLIL